MDKNLKGSSLIIFSTFFYASYGIWSRLMAGHFGEFNQAWTRAAFLLTLILIYLTITRSFKPISPSDRKWFLLIGLAGGLNQAPYFYGFANLPLGTAILIFYTFLTLAGFLIGKYLFEESIDRPKQLSFLLGLFGMGIVYQFSLAPDQILPAIGMAIAGFMGGTAGILPKKLSSHYSEPQIMTSYFLVMIFANLALSIIFQETIPPAINLIPWLAQLGYAFSMLIANLAVIAGFKYIEATKGSLIGLVEIIFGVIFGFAFFQESLSFSTILGGLCILAAAALPHLKIPISRSQG